MIRSFLLLLAAIAATSDALGAQPLGRLFFTPAERAQLDNARSQNQRAAKVAPEPVEVAQAPQIVTYSGIVRRSDGKSILWLNNRPVEEKEALAGLALTGRVSPDGAVILQVPETGASVNLKVGQRAELQSGKVAEGRPSALPLKTEPPSVKQTDEPAEKKAESAVTGAKPDSRGPIVERPEEPRPRKSREPSP
jgi:hypothetical protein